MSLLSILPDIIGGALAVVLVMFILFGFYKIYLWLKPKPKPTEDIYEIVAEHIASGEPFSKLAEHFSKFKFKEQQKYVQAYIDLDKLKGGKDEQNRKIARTIRE